MRNMLPFLILVTIPLLLAIAHDAYLLYENPDRQAILRKVQEDPAKLEEVPLLSEVGFLWTRYHPESYKLMRDSMEPADWVFIDKYMLDRKTVVVTGGFALFFYILIFGLTRLSSGSSRQAKKGSSLGRRAKRVDVLLGDAEQTGYKYKRK